MTSAGGWRAALGVACGVAVAALVAACPAERPAVYPPASPAPPATDTGGNDLRAVGATCSRAEECASGVCEGQGCGPDQGVCMSGTRTCTKDLVEYCGCDGQPFRGSGTCPGARYSRRGGCEVASARPDGSPCLSADECASGVCEGQGCGPDRPGECVSRERMCIAAVGTFCGCDGSTFTAASAGCPGRRYESRGACGGLQPVGGACTNPEQCESGICEGQGCGDDNPGTCAPKTRACTKDLRAYCGCDGVTFRGSGSCPGRRFQNRGACRP